ncbi:MAG: hypothetical protein JW995_09495 [Melioribacteraceae bacterium]|nr:hypothetical protein [Melioribacteraceae bacterium]
MKSTLKIIISILLTSLSVLAQSNVTENILRLDSNLSSPPASIEDVSWIAGHWKGEALGGIVEEVWTPPVGGSMMCAFKLVVDDTVKFYELVVIYEEGNSLILKLKHFHGDLKGWEEKDETLDFSLVKLEGMKAYFDGFTFELVNRNEMNIYVLFGSEGQYKEMKFSYKK